MGTILALVVVVLALLGMPLFTVMGGLASLAWLFHKDAAFHNVRYLAPDVLDNRFAGSPILVTIPLFTFVGYLMAESKTPDRIVRASQAFFGWMPGGLAIVCIVASAFFTTLTGGSGVTIVAIGGLLYPALRKQGYPENFSLGLVTTGGSLGLLLPPSLPILIYALVAGIDFNKAFKAGLIPGFGIMALLAFYSMYVAIKHKVPRSTPNLKEMGSALWLMKWELLVPVLILGGLGTGLTGLDEVAALAAFYTLIVEVFIYKDLSLKKDLPRVVKSSMSLAGAIIIILAMANALINYAIQEQVPNRVLEAMISFGLSQKWQFLLVLNVFLLVLGMVMDGFSAILVAVPLILPFGARFGIHPFHMAMMFLLNLEIAYCAPPLGLNLYIASFRFNRPVVSLYKVVVPAVVILTFGLLMVMYIPKISTVLVDRDSAALRADAVKNGQAPKEAWRLECVQEDNSNPLPCTPEDKAAYPGGHMPEPPAEKTPKPTEEKRTDDAGEEDEDEALKKAMRGAGKGAEPAPEKEEDEDEALKRLMKEAGKRKLRPVAASERDWRPRPNRKAQPELPIRIDAESQSVLRRLRRRVPWVPDSTSRVMTVTSSALELVHDERAVGRDAPPPSPVPMRHGRARVRLGRIHGSTDMQESRSACGGWVAGRARAPDCDGLRPGRDTAAR